MIARWDALLLAAVLSGGWMLIENSHRVDTGAADDAPVAMPVRPCAEAPALERADPGASDRPFSFSAADDDATPAACE